MLSKINQFITYNVSFPFYLMVSENLKDHFKKDSELRKQGMTKVDCLDSFGTPIADAFVFTIPDALDTLLTQIERASKSFAAGNQDAMAQQLSSIESTLASLQKHMDSVLKALAEQLPMDDDNRLLQTKMQEQKDCLQAISDHAFIQFKTVFQAVLPLVEMIQENNLKAVTDEIALYLKPKRFYIPDQPTFHEEQFQKHINRIKKRLITQALKETLLVSGLQFPELEETEELEETKQLAENQSIEKTGLRFQFLPTQKSLDVEPLTQEETKEVAEKQSLAQFQPELKTNVQEEQELKQAAEEIYTTELSEAKYLKECACCYACDREKPNNIRDQADDLVLASAQKLPANTPVKIVSIGSGDLKHEATLALKLMKAGYNVEFIFIDGEYIELANDNNHNNMTHVFGEFKSITTAAAKQYGRHCEVKGTFSSILVLDAIKHGQAAPQVPNRKFYWEFGAADQLKNKAYAAEFKTQQACKDFEPNMVLCIDDIMELGTDFGQNGAHTFGHTSPPQEWLQFRKKYRFEPMITKICDYSPEKSVYAITTEKADGMVNLKATQYTVKDQTLQQQLLNSSQAPMSAPVEKAKTNSEQSYYW